MKKYDKKKYICLGYEKIKDDLYIKIFDKETNKEDKIMIKDIYQFYEDKKEYIINEIPLEPPVLKRTKKSNNKILGKIKKKRKKRIV